MRSHRFARHAISAVLALSAIPLPGAANEAFDHRMLAPHRFVPEANIAVDRRADPATIYVGLPSTQWLWREDVPGAHVWRSTDGGETFEKGDSTMVASELLDIAVDDAGTLYVSHSAAGWPVFVSDDGGESYSRATNLPGNKQYNFGARAWIAATGAGRVAVTARSGGSFIWLSDDGAETFKGPYEIPVSLYGQLGPVRFAPDGSIWMLWNDRYTETVYWGRSIDGRTWTTGTVATYWSHPLTGNLYNVMHYPVISFDESGIAYAAWAARNPATRTTTAAFLSFSRDAGATWSEPRIVSDGSRSAVFPYVEAGAAGRVNIGYFQSSDLLPPTFGSPATTWDLVLSQSVNATAADPTWTSTVADAAVHRGSMCTEIQLCVTPQNWGYVNAGGPADRRMYDYLELAVDNDGLALMPHGRDPADHVDATPDVVFTRQLDGIRIR